MGSRAKTFLLPAITIAIAGSAWAHPHAGGVVVQGERVWVGDVIRSRLLVLERGGFRELAGFGHVRDLEVSPTGEIHGVSQGTGIWKIGAGETRVPLRQEFEGLFSLCPDGSMVTAPAESIDAMLCTEDGIVVTDDGTVRTTDRNGVVTTIAQGFRGRMYGIATMREEIIVPVYETGEVVEARTKRVLLRSEVPWRPVDVTFRDGALYVVELAHYPCCFKGPRVRRLTSDGRITTLLTIHEGNHVHLPPWLLPIGAAAALASAIVLVIRRVAELSRVRPGNST